MKPILVTTKYWGVFFGYVEDANNLEATTMTLKDARCAIRWSTTNGFMELAQAGPNENSKIGAKADILLHDITSVTTVSREAEAKWISY